MNYLLTKEAVVVLIFHFSGIPLTDGGIFRLHATIGLSRALDLILTGRSVDSEEAFKWGLASRIVACGTGNDRIYNTRQVCVRDFYQSVSCFYWSVSNEHIRCFNENSAAHV